MHPERLKALSDAVNILRRNADSDLQAARSNAKQGSYEAAGDLHRSARHFETAAFIVEHMIHKPELMEDDTSQEPGSGGGGSQ